jgi:hypothetical protein
VAFNFVFRVKSARKDFLVGTGRAGVAQCGQ